MSELSLEKLVLMENASKLLSPERWRCAVSHACRTHGMSGRLAGRVVKQPCGTQRYRPIQRGDEDRLTQAFIELASRYGRYGFAGSRRCCRGEAAAQIASTHATQPLTPSLQCSHISARLSSLAHSLLSEPILAPGSATFFLAS